MRLRHPRLSLLKSVCLLLLLARPLWAEIIITEIDAINIGAAEDADGNQRDWIELRNTGAVAVSLDGWALSDDLANPGKWVFPDVSLAAGQHLLVFASGKDWRIPGIELHTSFRLADGGGAVILSAPNGGGWTLMHLLAGYPAQRPGWSWGLAGSAGAGAAGYFETPTPGSLNGAAVVTAFVADTVFSFRRGFYAAPFELGITTATPGATLVYTLDGSEPTRTNGTRVAAASALATPLAAIPVAKTTVVRAMAFKAGLGRTNTDTHSYIFPAAVLAQDESHVTWPYAPWGHDKADTDLNLNPDWAMDPRVTGHANPEDRCVPGDLQNIPTVSIVMNWDELFGANGIYIVGEGIDKPASFEIINPDGNDTDPMASPAEHGRGEVRVFGGSSTEKRWKTDKLSFRFSFWQDFSSVILGDQAVGRYERLVLDARLNQTWTQSQNFEQRQFADYTRDAVLTDLENQMGVKSVHSQHVHLYLNGLYWGLYTLHERPDNAFAEAYFGGNKDDYDIVKHDPGHPGFLVDGLRIDPAVPLSNTNHTAGFNYLAMVARSAADLRVQANYDALAAVLDIPALADHILANFFGGNYDWPQHNWYASFNRADPGGRWRFHSWDAEHVFKYVDYPRFDNVTNKFEGWDRPDGIHLQLLQNPEYRFLFADAAHRHLFNGGAFAADRVWALFERRFTDINEAIRAESARWGDSGHEKIGPTSPFAGELHLRFSNIPSPVPATSIGQSDTTDFASWWHERERIRTRILGAEPNRVTRFLAQLRGAVYGEDHPLKGQPNPLYPATSAPVFSQHGGHVPAGFSLAMAHPNTGGVLYYTTDGSDPRQPFTGGSAFFTGEPGTSAAAYAGPVSISATTRVRARVLAGGEWSALNEALFLVGAEPASAANLVISEIHYHPADPSPAEVAAGFSDDGDFEYLAVRNFSALTVSIAGLSMEQGIDLELLAQAPSLLAPGGYALFVADPDAFAFRHGAGLPVAGRFIFGTGLSNGGERLHLKAADGSTITDFSYDDSPPWPLEPDGFGPSLVLVQPGLRDPRDGWNWRPSEAAGGAAGRDDYLSYAVWEPLHFPPDEPGYPAIAGPSADPDQDGLSNLEELFFGTDPRSATPAGRLPALTLETLDAGNGPEVFAVFTFRYMQTAEEVLFEPRASADLLDWNPGGLVLLAPPARLGDGSETRRYRSASPLSADTARFYSLELQLRGAASP